MDNEKSKEYLLWSILQKEANSLSPEQFKGIYQAMDEYKNQYSPTTTIDPAATCPTKADTEQQSSLLNKFDKLIKENAALKKEVLRLKDALGEDFPHFGV